MILLLLLLLMIHCLVLVQFFVGVLCLALVCFIMQYLEAIYFDVDMEAGCFTLIVFLMSCGC